jgi:hypothetical protein
MFGWRGQARWFLKASFSSSLFKGLCIFLASFSLLSCGEVKNTKNFQNFVSEASQNGKNLEAVSQFRIKVNCNARICHEDLVKYQAAFVVFDILDSSKKHLIYRAQSVLICRKELCEARHRVSEPAFLVQGQTYHLRAFIARKGQWKPEEGNPIFLLNQNDPRSYLSFRVETRGIFKLILENHWTFWNSNS